MQHICPQGGTVYEDKGYCVNPTKKTLKRKGCHNATIKKQHEGQESPKYRWLSSIRSPYERVFAYHNKKVRYRGLNKVQFQLNIRALVFNLKRFMVLDIECITLQPA